MTELARAQQAVVTALVRHSTYSHRASTAAVNRVWNEVEQIGQDVLDDLPELLAALGPAERQAFIHEDLEAAGLQPLLARIDQAVADIQVVVSREWSKSAVELAAYEAEYMGKVLERAVDGLPPIKADGARILETAQATPVLDGIVQVEDLLAEIAAQARLRLVGALREGMQAGRADKDSVRLLRGSARLRWRNGLWQRGRFDVERMIRTARHHVAITAHEAVYEQAGVRYVVVTAVLDGRTSKYCAAMDGALYQRGTAYPRPPYHIQCRTQLVPSFDGSLAGNRPFVLALKVRGSYRLGEEGERVPRPAAYRPVERMSPAQRRKAGVKRGEVGLETNYSRWFSRQDPHYQKEWLGPARYKLYKEGYYELDRFVDPRGKTYTLAELRARDEETFKRLFGQ